MTNRIRAMAKVDAAAKFVYLQEHQAWCELPLRVLCHGLASDLEAGDQPKVEATNKLKVYVETGHQKEAAQLGEGMLDILDDWKGKLTEGQKRSANDLLAKYPEVAACLKNLGSAYRKLGIHKRHSKKLEICMLLEVGYYGEEHPKVAAVLTNLSLVYQKELQFRAAKTYLKRSLKLHEMHFDEVHEHVAVVLCNLAVVCAELKKTKEADGHLDRCDEILDELGEGHAALSAKIKNNRAILHMWRGELTEATKKFRESLKLLAGKSEQSPELFIEFAEIRRNLGEVLLEMVEKGQCTEEERNEYCEEACTHLNKSIAFSEEFELKFPCASRKSEQVSCWKLLTKQKHNSQKSGTY